MSEARRRMVAAVMMALVAVAAAGRVSAATVRVIPRDGAREGFNDPTPVAPVGGNSGTTLGEQRRIAFEHAASLWAAQIVSAVEIRIAATFDPLTCSLSSTTLGVAGPVSVFRDFAGAPRPNTFYAAALADRLAGVDLEPAEDDIEAQFNSAFGSTCPFPAGWYYGLDGQPPGDDSDFVTVVLHELGHGLGFLTLADVESGQLFEGRADIFLTFLFDAGSGRTLETLTNAQRRTAFEATGSLRWNGPQVVAASGALVDGVDSLGRVEMYAPAFAQNGATGSHWSNEVAPAELMAPFLEMPLHDVGLAAEALADMGWELAGAPGCVGDCDGNGAVTINELILAVNISLGEAAASSCAAIDAGGDGTVTIDELVTAVGNALNGCRLP